MISHWIDITCDGCQFGYSVRSHVDPVAYLREKEWVQVGVKEFCPKCQASGKATEQEHLPLTS